MTLRTTPSSWLGLALALLACPTLARADDIASEPGVAPKPPAQDLTVGVTLTAATDYIFRGASQTNQNPAVFAEVDLAAHGFYLGGRTENVKFSGIRQEYDGWGGYIVPIGPVKLDVGFLRYGYINAATNIDTVEGKAALSTSIGKLKAHVAAYYTGNYFGTHHGAEYYELGASYPLLPKLTLGGTVGHQQVDRDFHYNTWKLGLAYALRKGIVVGVRYVDTDTSVFGDRGGSRVVGHFNISF